MCSKEDFFIKNYQEHIEKLNKEEKKHLEILEAFLNGEVLVCSDTVSSHQNTTSINYSIIIRDFIEDVNTSAQMVEKALKVFLNNELFVKPNPCFIDHQVILENETIVSLTIKDELNRYFQRIKTAAQTLEYLLPDARNKQLTEKEKNDILKSLDNFKSEKDKRVFLPNWRYYDFGPITKLGFYSPLSREQVNNLALFSHQQNKNKNYVFFPLGVSCALWEEKIISKETQHIYITEEDFNFDLNLQKSVSVKKNNNVTIFPKWDPDFSIAYYIKKHIIKTVSNMELIDFIAIHKEHIKKEVFSEKYKEDPSRYVEDHPSVIAIKQYNDMKKKIKTERQLYREKVIKLQKLIDYYEQEECCLSLKEWRQKIGHTLECSNEESAMVPSAQVLATLNQDVSAKILKIVEDDISSAGKKFVYYLQLDTSMDKLVKNLLNNLYGNAVFDFGNSIIQNTKSFGRGTVQHLMQNSAVLDFRNINYPKMNEVALALTAKNQDFAELVQTLKNCKYHNLFEIDMDITKQDSLFSFRWLNQYMKNIDSLKLPSTLRTNFKIRKLGNHKALGIYFLHTRTLALDYREDKNGACAYIHETAHHIDLNADHEYRQEMLRLLYGFFEPILTERKDYFLKEEELIARAGEVAKILYITNYVSLKRNLDTETLIRTMKMRFSSSLESQYMHTWEEYNTYPQYVPIEKSIRSRNTELLDNLYWYFQQFWNNKIVNFSINENIGSMFTRKREEPASSEYNLIKEHDVVLDKINNRELADSMSKFVLTTLPSVTTRACEEFDKNILLIKKAWMIFLNHGKEIMLDFLHQQPEQPYVTQKVYDKILEDFTLKYQKDADFEEQIKKMRNFLGLIYLM